MSAGPGGGTGQGRGGRNRLTPPSASSPHRSRPPPGLPSGSARPSASLPPIPVFFYFAAPPSFLPATPPPAPPRSKMVQKKSEIPGFHRSFKVRGCSPPPAGMLWGAPGCRQGRAAPASLHPLPGNGGGPAASCPPGPDTPKLRSSGGAAPKPCGGTPLSPCAGGRGARGGWLSVSPHASGGRWDAAAPAGIPRGCLGCAFPPPGCAPSS